MNAMELANHNYEEALRQHDKALADFRKGLIPEERLKQLQHLRDIAAEDLHRVEKDD